MFVTLQAQYFFFELQNPVFPDCLFFRCKPPMATLGVKRCIFKLSAAFGTCCLHEYCFGACRHGVNQDEQCVRRMLPRASYHANIGKCFVVDLNSRRLWGDMRCGMSFCRPFRRFWRISISCRELQTGWEDQIWESGSCEIGCFDPVYWSPTGPGLPT